MRTLATTVLLALTACPGEQLVGATGELEVQPRQLDFGRVWVGRPATLPLTVSNRGRAPLVVEAITATLPFTTVGRLELAASQTLTVEVTLTAETEGALEGTLHVGAFDVALTADAQTPATCTPPSECVVSTFDPATGACVEAPAADGAACGTEQACIANGRCLGGQCRGETPACDDANACTRDGCAPGIGCTHYDAAFECPQGSGCQVATCAPLTGCGFQTVPDGEACGESNCAVSNVCIAGTCTEQPTPRGGHCGTATACRPRGTCVEDVCQQAAFGAPQLAWRYAPPTGRSLSFSGHTAPNGDVYFFEFDTMASQNAELVSLSKDGFPRFRVQTGWSTLALDLVRDRVITSRRGVVTARSARDGALLWQTDTTAGVPVHDPAPSGPAFSTSFLLVFEDGTVAEVLMEGSSDHWSYVIALDGATGAKKWEVAKKGHVYLPGITQDGTLWVSSANCWAPAGEMARFDSSGRALSATFMGGVPVVYASDEGFLTTGSQVLRTSSPTPFNLGTSGNPSYQSAWRPGRLFWLSSSGLLHAFDYPVLQPAWSASVGLASQLNATSNGGALSLTGTTLTGVDVDGHVSLQCAFPSPPSGQLPVAAGRLFAIIGGALTAYELPGWNTETRGWAAASGGLSRDGRVH